LAYLPQKQIGADNDVLFYLKPINQAISIIQDAYKAGEGLNAPSISTPGSYPNEEYTDEFNTVDIFGRIVDAYTLEPIPYASFIVLAEGITIEEFANNPLDTMILSYVESDSNGFFTCHNIPCGGVYSVIADADYYFPLAEDNFIYITFDSTSFIDIGDIYLEMSY
jgi:hypothetical protein